MRRAARGEWRVASGACTYISYCQTNANALRGCFWDKEQPTADSRHPISCNVLSTFDNTHAVCIFAHHFGSYKRDWPGCRRMPKDAQDTLALRKLQCVFNLWHQIGAQTETVISCDEQQPHLHLRRLLFIPHAACLMPHVTHHTPHATCHRPQPISVCRSSHWAYGNLRCSCQRAIVAQLTKQLIKMQATRSFKQNTFNFIVTENIFRALCQAEKRKSSVLC